MLIAAIVCVAIAAVVYSVWIRPHLFTAAAPQPGSAKYEEYVEAFSIGVAAIDFKPDTAQDSLTKATGIFAGEPAAWANLGLLAIRDGRIDDAIHELRMAESLTPAERFPAEASTIQQLLGVAEQKRGKLAAAIDHFRRAVALEPKNVQALYRLAKAIEQQHEPGSDAEFDKLLNRIIETDPQNLYILQDRLKAAATRGDRAASREIADRFKPLAAGWRPQLKSAFDQLEKALADPKGQIELGLALPFLGPLKGEPEFARSAAAVDAEQKLESLVIDHFVVLAEPKHTPADPDTEIQFVARPLEGVPDGEFDALVPAWLDDKSPPTLLLANSKRLRQIGGKIDLPSIALGQRGLVPIDWNNDFHTDILLAGSGGLRFFQQKDDGSFADVTADTKLPAEVLNGDYFAAWAADIDLDGDLDIVLARRSGSPLLLQNNFDGTWTPKPIFESVEGARAFVWADLDNDGLSDAAILDSRGKLHVFANERSGHFLPWHVPPPTDTFLALAAGDVYNDGTIALVALRDDGAMMRIAASNKRPAWQTSELARWDKFPALPLETSVGALRLITADLDNNGFPDLLVSTHDKSRVWLGDGFKDTFGPLAAELPGGITAAVDLDGKGRLDVVGLDRDGRPFRLANVGKKNYHWQTVRPLAVNAKGDDRINSFGIGGQVEVRTGTFFLKQPIDEPGLHFGLGNRTRADVVRIVWPNGTSQVEFAPPVNATLVAIQRLKGSCPFLFAWNGERFAFVADFMWSTPLGMYINAQNNGKLGVTTEWVKIRGDQLVPRSGRYELRGTANLWETHYFDHLALIALDHPERTELVVDERFSPTSTGPTMYLVEPPRPLAAARNSRGEDVSDIVSKVDGRYLDDFERGVYQGLAADHWVECELPADVAAADGPLLLLATGWIHPTDSSINFALEQGHRERPRDLSLEIPDGHGGWKIASDHLGFPAGKNKTMAIRLDGIDGGIPQRFRLRTNMEIYWDALQLARVRSEVTPKMTKLLAETAELDYRGIVEMTEANRSSPELPNYDRVVSRGQVWRDLVGYHTRFGDVRELLENIDDRYAILSAGDEIAISFKAPPAPPAGWKRDFIWVSDGWVKDGDFNTRFGGTVLPLPSHNATSYDTPPGQLEDDPVYKKHPLDWQNYHTRYITPDFFERGLRGFKKATADERR